MPISLSDAEIAAIMEAARPVPPRNGIGHHQHIHRLKAPVGWKRLAHSGERGLAPSPVIDKIRHLLGGVLDDWWADFVS
jgi:hypothetical protein